MICAEMTSEFLEFTKSRGNDLSTPSGASFPGLKPGDRWCLCALRWHEANLKNKAPLVVSRATEKMALRYVPLKELSAKQLKEEEDANKEL